MKISAFHRLTMNNVKSYFINWSNHPSSTWQPEQLAAAQELGEIVDKWFPVVDVNDDIVAVDRKARSAVEELCNRFPDPAHVVFHVQGEMTFLYRALLVLQAKGYRAVASTTWSDVHYEGEKRVSVFHFAGFRDYFLVNPR